MGEGLLSSIAHQWFSLLEGKTCIKPKSMGLYFVPFTNIIPSHGETPNRYQFSDKFSPMYNGGDGYDAEALDFLNVPEALDYRLNQLTLPNTNTIDATIAILDTGIDETVWNKLETDYDVEIAFVYIYEYCSSSFLGFCTGYTIDWRLTFDPTRSYVDDPVGHGNWVSSVVAQTAPTANIYVVNIADHNFFNYPIRTDFVKKAFDIIYQDGTPMANIITMSFGGPIYDQGEQDRINLLTDAGVEIFASAGNLDIYDVEYPANYVGVRAVSAIYDDRDGSMVNGGPISTSYICDRVTKSKTSNLLVGIRTPWGSSYSEGVRFAAPGFDVEVWGEGPTAHVVDGTSFSTPFVAAIALLVYDLLLDQGYDLTSIAYRGATYYVLEVTAQGFIGDHVVTPIINLNPSSGMWNMEFGHGSVDAYDAVVYAVELFGAPTIVITSPSTSSVTGTVQIQADVYDDGYLTSFEIYINNVLVYSNANGRYTYSWNTLYYPSNSVIKIIATDNDYKTTEVLKYVTVSNGGGCGGCPT